MNHHFVQVGVDHIHNYLVGSLVALFFSGTHDDDDDDDKRWLHSNCIRGLS